MVWHIARMFQLGEGLFFTRSTCHRYAVDETVKVFFVLDILS
jgi:hypothetical protein